MNDLDPGGSHSLSSQVDHFSTKSVVTLTFRHQRGLAPVIHAGAQEMCKASTIITAEQLHAALLLLNDSLKRSD